jgi:hypothetical protein
MEVSINYMPMTGTKFECDNAAYTQHKSRTKTKSEKKVHAAITRAVL